VTIVEGLSDKFVKAFRNPQVRDAILHLLKDTTPELYEEATRYTSSDASWDEFLEDVFRGRLDEFIRAQSRNLDSKFRILDDMEMMILEKETLETDMKAFFLENPWIIGFEYQELTKEKRAGEDKVIDYRLKRLDDNFDLVEIKGPNDPVFRSGGGRISFTRKMADAVLQIMDYVNHYDKYFEYTAHKEGIEVYKPRGFLMIGKAQEDTRRSLNMVNSFLFRIDIVTYDDVLKKARNAVQVLSGKRIQQIQS